jgi:hypothetical protein
MSLSHCPKARDLCQEGQKMKNLKISRALLAKDCKGVGRLRPIVRRSLA